MLTVQHPLEESRETLAFATEPVFSSLANLLGKHENLPIPLPSNIKDFKFYEVEIKYGLMQVCNIFFYFLTFSVFSLFIFLKFYLLQNLKLLLKGQNRPIF